MKNKCHCNDINLHNYKLLIKSVKRIEHFIAQKNNRLEIHKMKWKVEY